MVQSVQLSTNANYSTMSNNNSINASADFSAEAIENDVIAFQEIPLTALSKRSLRKLSHLLNSRKILRSEEGYERDWRGLASLSKQRLLCDENAVYGDDPTTKVIQLWCSNNPKTATFAYLEQFLGIIDRWDVSDDIFENLVEDTKTYQTQLQTNPDDNVDTNSMNNYEDFNYGFNTNILTSSDVVRAQKGLPPQIYDAYVLYADADLNYASEMLTKLEDNPEYNIKLFLKDRDLLGGVPFEPFQLTRLIEERCKNLIVILTEEFLKSPENKFLVEYTQYLQLKQKKRRLIVPLLYDVNIDIPRTLKMYTILRYNPGTSTLYNFWSKLIMTILKEDENVDNTTTLFTLNNKEDSNSNSVSNRQTSTCHLKNLPSSPTQIPSISIIPPDDSAISITEERIKQKSLTITAPRSKDMIHDGNVLRSAHSTGQLHTQYNTKNTTSMSDLSTTDAKKKRKWSSKILKKVFSRSSSKLQEA